VEGENIALNWMTASEMNNVGFNLQRSTNAQDFTNIAWLDGNGTTTEMNVYDYLDTEVSTGQNYYYRLEQVDTDGTKNYSQVVSAQVITDAISNLDIVEKIKLYPNPTADVVQVEFLEDLSFNQVIIRDLFGRIVRVESGNFSSISVADLSEGVYFFVFENEIQRVVKRVVVGR